MKALLFITATRIGDAVLSTSALAAARAAVPAHTPVVIACGPLAAPLFRAEPDLAELVVLDKRVRGYWLNAWRRFRRRSFALAVDLRGSGVTYLLAAQRRIVHRRGAPDVHKVTQLAALMGADPAPAPRLHLDREADAAAAAVAPGAGYLALGPGANFSGKRWAPERFAAAAALLAGPGGPLAGRGIVALGGPDEAQACAEVSAGLAARGLAAVNAAGRLDLPAAAAAIARAGLYLGNDSGLMHMAAAVGAPTIGLFGPSNPAVYGPWGAHCRALRGPTPYHPNQERDAVGGRALMDAITPEAVAAAAEALLQEIRR